MARDARKELRDQEQDAEGTLLEAIVSRGARPRVDGVVIGRLAGFGADGRPLVEHPAHAGDSPVAARSTSPVGAEDVGSEVALLFEDGDPERPILVGCVRERLDAPVEAEIDDRRVTLEGRERVVLRCGKASITLTRDGRIVLRGVHLLSRATRSNRIRGGSVQLN